MQAKSFNPPILSNSGKPIKYSEVTEDPIIGYNDPSVKSRFGPKRFKTPAGRSSVQKRKEIGSVKKTSRKIRKAPSPTDAIATAQSAEDISPPSPSGIPIFPQPQTINSLLPIFDFFSRFSRRSGSTSRIGAPTSSIGISTTISNPRYLPIHQFCFANIIFGLSASLTT